MIRTLARELLCFSPSIAFFGFLASRPDFISQRDREWIFGVSFLVVELTACVIAALGALALAHQHKQPLPWERPVGAGVPREQAFLGIAVLLLAVIPGLFFGLTSRWWTAVDAACGYSPRLLLLWRIRDADRSTVVIALLSALVGPLLFATFVAGFLIFGSPADAGDSDHTAALICAYYFLCAIFAAALRRLESKTG